MYRYDRHTPSLLLPILRPVLRSTRAHRVFASVLVAALLLAACGDEAGVEGGEDATSPSDVETQEETSPDAATDPEPSLEVGDESDASDADAPPRRAYDPDPPTTLGTDRPAQVYLPRGYDPSARDYPLVMMLHGYSANATAQDFVFGLKPRVDVAEFILITPEGTRDTNNNRFWNATEVCCDFGATGVDDSGYLAGLLEEAIELYAVDRARVALVGHSNGGFMSYRMACDRPDLVRAVGVLAGSTFRDEALCRGTEPVAVLHMHGTEDATVSYAQDNFSMGAEVSAARWAAKAGCDATPSEVGRRDYFPALDGEETLVLRHEGCPDGVDIEVWRIDGGDHILIGNVDAFKDDLVGFLTTPRPIVE